MKRWIFKKQGGTLSDKYIWRTEERRRRKTEIEEKEGGKRGAMLLYNARNNLKCKKMLTSGRLSNV
jgi:SLT domain-containing protein